MTRYRAKPSHDDDDIEMTKPPSRRWKLRRPWGKSAYAYTSVPTNGDEPISELRSGYGRRLPVVVILVLGMFAVYMVLSRTRPHTSGRNPSCDNPSVGYECRPDISHSWGQYSAYFSVPSAISAEVPAGCSITFAQILSRHGGRYPTHKKHNLYSELIEILKRSVTSYEGIYAFLNDYEYMLDEDRLTAFGQQQMVNSGLQFFKQYQSLASESVPFIRVAGQERVVQSAENFTQGFHIAKVASGVADDDYPYHLLKIPEGPEYNNSLNHGLCDRFENEPISEIGRKAQATWMGIFIPPIQDRLHTGLPGSNFTQSEVIYMMDLCPFETIASFYGTVSPFCDLFTKDEWHQYDYFESLGKYYGPGSGNPLGAAQGIAFANELIARLTGEPVNDSTHTNRTLNEDPATFPLDRALYADFSHDNDMMGVYAALGLYNGTAPPSNTSMESVQEMNGFSASWVVPFAARAVFEKMQCQGEKEELVRVLVNDRVVPLETCGADELGRCTLGGFVDSLSFVASGGNWNDCFA